MPYLTEVFHLLADHVLPVYGLNTSKEISIELNIQLFYNIYFI